MFSNHSNVPELRTFSSGQKSFRKNYYSQGQVSSEKNMFAPEFSGELE